MEILRFNRHDRFLRHRPASVKRGKSDMKTKRKYRLSPSDLKAHVGKKYGHWTVLRYVGMPISGQRMFTCQCRCGAEQDIYLGNLLARYSNSCMPCAQRIRHGDRKLAPKWYRMWTRVKAIGCEPSWNVIEQFHKDVSGLSREKNTTIIALDPARPLGPDNFRWGWPAYYGQKKYKLLTIKGESRPAHEWTKILSVSRQCVYRLANHEAGLCRCGGERSNGSVHCERCLTRQRGGRTRKSRRLIFGTDLCQYGCGNPHTPEYLSCFDCREKHRLKMRVCNDAKKTGRKPWHRLIGVDGDGI